MERQPKLKTNMSTYHLLNIQHKMNELNLHQDHLLHSKFSKYREDMFNRKINRLQKSIESIQSYITDDINDQQPIMTSSHFPRIKTQFHLLNFSPETQKRLLCQPPISKKSNKQIINHLPPISRRTNSDEIEKCIKRITFYRTRLPSIYSCRSRLNNKNCFQTYLHQQISNEHQNQIEHDERKVILLKQIDELKHSIDDPHSTLSALAALSRALLSSDSEI